MANLWKLLTSEMVLGSGHFTIALTIPESAKISFANMTNPRKTTSDWKKELCKLIQSFPNQRTSKTNLKCFRCPSLEGLYISMSSKYTTKNFPRKG